MELRCRKRPRIDTPEKALRLTNDCSTLALSEDKIANHFSCNGVSNAIGSDNNRSEPSCMMLTITRFKHHSLPDGKLPNPLRAIGLTSPDKLTKNGCLSQHNGYHGLPLVTANGLTAPVVKVNGFSSVVGHYLSSDSTQPSQNGDVFCALANRRVLRAARTRVCDGIEVGGHDGNSWTDMKDGNETQFSPALAEASLGPSLGPKEPQKSTTELDKEPEPAASETSTDLHQQPHEIRKLSHICKDKNSSSSSSASSLSSTSGFGGVVPLTKDKATCQWNGCGEDIEVDALLEHMTRTHIVSQAKAGTDEETKFVCLWNGCKFYNRSSVLQTWLERHVLCHLGDKPYRCIVPHCRMRFASQFLLNRHINGHLDQSRPLRKGDTAARQMKKKKLRNTKPCPVRTEDYFDSVTMESIQNELVRSTQLTQVDLLHSGNTITFHSSILARRVDSSGHQETLLRWRPRNLLPDQWVPESQVASYARQVVPLSSLPSDVLRMLTLPPRPHQGHSNHHRKNRRK